MRRILPFIIILVVLIVAGGAVVLFLRSRSTAITPGQSLANSSTPSASSDSNTPAMQPTDAHMRGAPNAQVTIEEFGDYQCPPCGHLHPDMKKVEEQFGDRMRFVFRNFPMKMHEHAVEAARAAEAAGLQGKFWEMHDMLYDKQESWRNEKDVRPIFIEYAHELGLDVDRFARDMDSPQTEQRVTADQKWGESLGVNATPTVFINGRQLRPEMMTADGMTMAINYLLSQKKQ